MKRTLTRKDYEEFQSDERKVLERMREEAEREDTRDCIKQVIELYTKKCEDHPEDGDGALLGKLARLQKGPSAYTKFLWKLGDVKRYIIEHFMSVLGSTTVLIFLLLAPLLINLIYSIKFGLGVQGLWGTVVFGIVALIGSGAGWHFNREYFRNTTIISLTIFGLFFLTKTATTPSVGFGVSVDTGEHIGYVVRDGKVRDVVIPNDSKYPSDRKHTFFMKAPNFFMDNVYWFSHTDTTLSVSSNASDSDGSRELTAHIHKRLLDISEGDEFPGVIDDSVHEILKKEMERWMKEGSNESELLERIQSTLDDISTIYYLKLERVVLNHSKTIEA